MERLHLLKPDVVSGYLNEGKGQEVTYLHINDVIDVEELMDDVAAGALPYKALAEFAKKKPSQFVIVKCTNLEEGRMAVSYLSSIYNHADGVGLESYDGFEISEEADHWNEEINPNTWNRDEDGEDEENWEQGSEWVENPWRVPLIKDCELTGGSPISPFGFGGINYAGAGMPSDKLPYWYYTRKENICVEVGNNGYIGNLSEVSKQLKRFKNNRHVFIILYDVYGTYASDTDDDDDMDDVFGIGRDDSIYEIILNYAAGFVDISCENTQRKAYYKLLFENWIQRKRYQLEEDFPTRKVTERIVAIDDANKSELIEKVINYVIRADEKVRTLKEEDFAVLDYFKTISKEKEEQKQKSAKKLREELVGMEHVKEQITGIVEVMKYNKRRAAMGLGSGSYHNVHMLLGAPGTAKTTVAELLGNMMAEEHLLSSGKFISVNGAELKGMYVGHSAPKVKALFDEYNVILIDEAYAMASDNNGQIDSFSQEAIAQLIIELEKHGMDRLVMFAGYGGEKVSDKDNKMKEFLQSNPGIRSRINSTIYFDSYSPNEMVEIFKRHAKLNHYRLPRTADAYVRAFFENRVKADDFGNGREARSLLENSIVEAAKRLASVKEELITEKMMKELKLVDIKKAIKTQEFSKKVQTGTTKAVIGF